MMGQLNEIQDKIINDRRRERAAIRAGGGPPPVSKDLLDIYLEAMEGDLEGANHITNEDIQKNIHGQSQHSLSL